MFASSLLNSRVAPASPPSKPASRKSATVPRCGKGKRRRLESQAPGAASEPPFFNPAYYAPMGVRGAEESIPSWPNDQVNSFNGLAPDHPYNTVRYSSVPAANTTQQVLYSPQHLGRYWQDINPHPSPGFTQPLAPSTANAFNGPNHPTWNPVNMTNSSTDASGASIFVNPPFFSNSYPAIPPSINPMLSFQQFMNTRGEIDPSQIQPTSDGLSSPRRARSQTPPVQVPAPTSAYLEQASQPPQRSPPRPLLVILDLNGTLIYRKHKKLPPSFAQRAGLDHFLDVLTRKYAVMIWTSSKPGTCNAICDILFPKDSKRTIVARWARDKFGLTLKQYNSKLQVYKQLHKVWRDSQIRDKHPAFKVKAYGGKFAKKKARQAGANPSQPWDQTNTVLIDDSKIKALSEPYNILEIPEYTNKPGIDESELFTKVLERLEVLSCHDDVSRVLRVWNERLAQVPGGNILDLDISPEKPDRVEEDDSDDPDDGGGASLPPIQQSNNNNPGPSTKKNNKQPQSIPTPEEKLAMKKAKKERKKARKAEKKILAAAGLSSAAPSSAPTTAAKPPKNQKKAPSNSVLSLQAEGLDGPVDINRNPNGPPYSLRARGNTQQQDHDTNASIPDGPPAFTIPGLLLASPSVTSPSTQHNHVDPSPPALPTKIPKPSPLSNSVNGNATPVSDAESVYSPTSFTPLEPGRPTSPAISSASENSLLDRLEEGLGLRR